MKIAILISGRGSNMAALAENRQGFEICLVAADRPAAGLETAQKNGHRTALIDRKKYPAKQSHEAALADEIAAHDPDWIIWLVICLCCLKPLSAGLMAVC